MAIWAIPRDKIIDYSPTGDDVDLFSQKVKYCLEEAFVSLKDLHDNGTGGDVIGGTSVAINNVEDGQILIYDGTSQNFNNVGLMALLSQSPLAHDIAHLQRLVENIYLALSVAGLDPGGYDALTVSTATANDIDTERSTFTTTADGEKILSNAVIITTPIFFLDETTATEQPKSRAHLVVKHQNAFNAQISAEIALYDGLGNEPFTSMTWEGTYPDRTNANRATTEFTYSGIAGSMAVLKITLDHGGGESFFMDSFACMFNE